MFVKKCTISSGEFTRPSQKEATYISFLLLVIAQGWNIGRIGAGHGITVAE